MVKAGGFAQEQWHVPSVTRTHEFEPDELISLADALQRYHYYIEAGIPDEHIMGLHPAWLENISDLVPSHRYSRVSNETYKILIESIVQEVRADFSRSMRKAIIDYLLKSQVERRCDIAVKMQCNPVCRLF